MNTTSWLLIIAAVIIGVSLSLLISRNNGTKRYIYKKRPYLLTQNELAFYKSLLPVANANKLIVCPKVRLADLIEPIKGKNFQAGFNKIRSKHIDFVLCDPGNLKPVLALELDDRSHDRPDRQARDQFVDNALSGAGLPILHTRSTNDLEKKIAQLTAKGNSKK